MHFQMHNNDVDILDILLTSVHYSAKLQIAKIHKKLKIKLSVQGELGVRIFI